MTGDHSEPEKMIPCSPGTVIAVIAAVSCLQRVHAAETLQESVDVIEGGAVTLKCRLVTDDKIIFILN